MTREEVYRAALKAIEITGDAHSALIAENALDAVNELPADAYRQRGGRVDAARHDGRLAVLREAREAVDECWGGEVERLDALIKECEK